MNIKVVTINNYWRFGGAERVFVEYINVLKRKYDVYSACSDKECHLKLEIYKTPFQYIFNVGNFWKLYRRLLILKPNFIHFHNYYYLSPSVLLAVIIYKRKFINTKIIQTLHDFHLFCPNASMFNFNKNEICNKCVRKRVKLSIFKERCDRRGLFYSWIKGVRSLVDLTLLDHKNTIDLFIVPSELMKSFLISEGIKAERIKLLRNPIMKIPRRISIVNKKNIIVYIGRISPEKNIELLIKAFQSINLKNWKLNIIGKGDQAYFEYLRRISKSENINFLGYVPPEDMDRYLEESKILVLPSKWLENAPVSILEAYTAGVKPLVPDIGGGAETVKLVEGTDGIFGYNSLDSLIQTMRYFMENYSKWGAKLNDIMQNIKEYFGINNFSRKLRQIYESLY